MKSREECSRREKHKKEKEEHRRGKRHKSEWREEGDEYWRKCRKRRDSSSESDERRREEDDEERRRRRKKRSNSAEEVGERRREGSVGEVRHKKRCRRHRRHTHSPSNQQSTIKHEQRDSELKPREKSRWENGDNSPDDRETRGGSLLRAFKNEDTSEMQWGKSEGGKGKERPPPENKAKPDFGLSGKLAQEINTFNGVVIKYSEPGDARKPKRRWRLYPFKGDVGLPTLYVHRQSAYLIGRDRKIADLPVDHPSCSKQHAVLQYRAVSRPNGPGLRVAPYIIDLESANGTYINNNKVEPRKYVELLEKDVIKFAYSSREYVLLHEHSKDDEADDHVQE